MAPIGGTRAGVFGGGVAIPDSGVSRWEFEQDVTDSWIGYDGTITGDPQFVTDSQVGEFALDFDGVGDRVNFGQIPETEGVAEVSLSAWVNLDAVQNSLALGAYPNNDDSLFMGTGGGTDYFFRVESGGTNVTYIVDTADTNVWEHWVLTFNSGEMNVYIDNTNVFTGTGGPSTTSSVHGDIYTAFQLNNGTYLDGTIDDPRIYSKELTSTEVSNLYNTGSIDG